MARYRLYYHFVWGTKDRLPLLHGPVREAVFNVIVAKVLEMRGIVHALNGVADHVHLLATIPPSVSPAQLMANVKGSSSHLASKLLAPTDNAFAWQAEYDVISVSEAHVERLIRYIQNQQNHHASSTLNATLDAIE